MGCGCCFNNEDGVSGVENIDRKVFGIVTYEFTELKKKWTWTEWKRPFVAVVLTFLCNVESSMLAVGEWPYMTTVSDCHCGLSV